MRLNYSIFINWELCVSNEQGIQWLTCSVGTCTHKSKLRQWMMRRLPHHRVSFAYEVSYSYLSPLRYIVKNVSPMPKNLMYFSLSYVFSAYRKFLSFYTVVFTEYIGIDIYFLCIYRNTLPLTQTFPIFRYLRAIILYIP